MKIKLCLIFRVESLFLGVFMSFLRVIVVIMFGFGSAPLLGMEKEQKLTPFKYSNPYFDPELQKTLLLLMQKNSDHEKLALDKDIVMVIAKKNILLSFAILTLLFNN